MAHDSLRSALRRHTRDIHQQLDSLVGAFGEIGYYRAYLVRTYRFRSAVEPALSRIGFWSPPYLCDALGSDLDDLEIARPAPAVCRLAFSTRAAQLGALYVLEGSAIGARSLLRRAAALGLGAEHGARHLVHQSAGIERWPTFLKLLEHQLDGDRSQALSAARSVFEVALWAYEGEVDERF